MDEGHAFLGAHAGFFSFRVPGRPGVATLNAVRGDSRRDLYAKTLALFGLGVLAGAGAVVDYWPVGVRLQVGESAFAQPFDPLPGPLPVPAPQATAAIAHRDQPSPGAVARAPVAVRASYASLPTSGLVFELGDPVDLQPLPPPELVLVRSDLSLASVPVRLMAPAGTSLRAEAAGLAATASDRDGGFITGAFRKTGSSIVVAGARTGTSLIDAARVVGSMFRRALPD